MTAKRAAILQVLRDSEGHLTAEEIFRLAQEKCPGIALATVYNTLHYLTENGHIKHIRTADGPDFYDKTPGPHEHAFCTSCGRVLDVELGDLAAEFTARTGYDICAYDLVLHTLCSACKHQHS